MEQAVVKQEVAVMQDTMSIEKIKSQVGLVKQVAKEVMEEGLHYGVIPGCKKPSLLKPGAEKLILTFRLKPDYQVEHRIEQEKIIMYSVKCTLSHIHTGLEWGTGIGTCNSREKKYIKNDPWDIQNTIMKMAEKRALVAAVLGVTAASDIFTQDMEDVTNGKKEDKVSSPATAPHSTPYHPPTTNSANAEGKVWVIKEPDSLISEKQVNRLCAIAKGSGWSNEQRDSKLKVLGWNSKSDITKGKYNETVDVFKLKPSGEKTSELQF